MDPGRRAPAYEVFVDFLDHAEVDLSDGPALWVSPENFSETPMFRNLHEIEEIPSAESSTPVKAAAEETLVVLNIIDALGNVWVLITDSKQAAAIQPHHMHVMQNKDGKTIVTVHLAPRFKGGCS